MNKTYNSSYGMHIMQFIEMKRTLGFKFTTAAIILAQIDTLAARVSETSPGITKSFADAWGKKRPNESDAYHHARVSMLAMLSSYMNDKGIPSFIPKMPRYKEGTFVPYIYSAKERDDIFKACDDLRLNRATMSSGLFSVPALIRLLFATGLRISEALDLKNDDVDLEEKYIRVKDSKNGKERIIPISESLVIVCTEYVKFRSMLPISIAKSTNFFVSLNGKRCSYQSTQAWFKKCLRKVGIPHVGRNQLPRIHDLRHTFAVTSLANMAQAGIDLYASLPVLSSYLGHQSLEGTNHYVRLTANMYPDLLNHVDAVCLDVFPKFKNYEAD